MAKGEVVEQQSVPARAQKPRPLAARRAAALEGAALAVVVVIALALRWTGLGITPFDLDQQWVVEHAQRFVAQGEFPLAGIGSSVGMALGPVEVLLLSLPVALGLSVPAIAGYVGLLQVLAIVGTYLLARRYFGVAAALAAAALFAVNPWTVHYGRKIWTPDMMPLFTVLLFAGLFLAMVERRRSGFVLACVGECLLLLIHPSAAMFAPVVALAALLVWREQGLKPLGLGLLAALAVASPYLLYQVNSGFEAVRKLGGLPGEASSVDLQALGRIIALASAADFPAGAGYEFAGALGLPDLGPVNAAATLLLALGLAVCLWEIWRGLRGRRPRLGQTGTGLGEGHWRPYALLLIWFLAPIAVSARHGMYLHPHYFIVVYPLQFVLIGLAISRLRYPVRLLSRRIVGAAPYWLALPAVVVAALLVVPQAVYSADFVALLQQRRPGGTFGVPYIYMQAAVDNIEEEVAAHPGLPVYVYSYNYRLPLDYLAGAGLTLHHVDPPMVVVVPKDVSHGVLAVLCSDDSATLPYVDKPFRATADDGPLVGGLRALGFAEQPERAVQGPDGYTYFRFFYLPPASEGVPTGFAQTGPKLVLGNGMALVGYRLGEEVAPGGQARLELLWWLPEDPAKQTWAEHNLFVHLLDTQGNVVAQHDWELWQYLGWQSGEYMLTEHELPVGDWGPGLLWLDVGAYERYNREPLPWLDAAGTALGPALKLGPLPVRAGPVPAAQKEISYRFGDALLLAGYDLAQTGDRLQVGLHWQGLGPTRGRYVVSVQVLDAAGKLEGQTDGEPVAGQYPTSAWREGEAVLDEREVRLGAGEAAGRHLAVVVYEPNSGRRLVVSNAQGESLGDYLDLGPID
ncbi:MAG: glycosyltransferase family 39 protein [Dehalococcoidales bacterium]|nr:glycosyltransferase family 39 protein [Dehalococcoidales bacterium]